MTPEEAKEILGFEITDPYFREHQIKNLTKGFCEWWVKFYDTPECYLDNQDELDEYYTRMEFALFGWNARNQWNTTTPPTNRTILTWRGNAWPPYYKIGTDGTGGGTYREYYVTHWIDLPDPPNEQSNQNTSGRPRI